MKSQYRDVLIVDDEPQVRAILKRKLKEAGYRVLEAMDGEEALKILRKNMRVALVLLDIRLPTINGLDIFDAVRAEFPEKKIIVSSVLKKDDQKFLLYQADDYYNKSEDLSVLIEKINNINFDETKKGGRHETGEKNFSANTGKGHCELSNR